MSLIQITDLTFAYEDSFDNIFEHANIQIDRSWRLCLTGRNGRGKTTLLRLFMGELKYHGQISANVNFSYFPCSVKDLNFTAGEVAKSLCPTAQESEILRELSFLDVEEEVLERPFSTLSGGQRTKFKTILRKLGFLWDQLTKNMADFSGGQKKKVLIARSLCEKAHLCIWDEPLNFIDVLSRMQIEELLLEYQPTLLFVEHDKLFCDRIATKTVVI